MRGLTLTLISSSVCTAYRQKDTHISNNSEQSRLRLNCIIATKTKREARTHLLRPSLQDSSLSLKASPLGPIATRSLN
jgi:hypothetical protein